MSTDNPVLGGRSAPSDPPIYVGGAPAPPNPPHFTGLLLVNLGKIRSNFVGVCRIIFDDNMTNVDVQKVGTTPPIEKALVN